MADKIVEIPYGDIHGKIGIGFSLNATQIRKGLHSIGRNPYTMRHCLISCNISGLQLIDIACISEYHLLQNLNISNNRLTSLKCLKDLPHLKELDASNNSLEDFLDYEILEDTDFSVNAPWENLRSWKASVIRTQSPLQTVNLSANLISSVQNIAHHGNICTLNLSRNKISDVTALFSSKNLKHLDVSYNNIASLKGLENSLLQCLNISHNCITGNLGIFPIITVSIPENIPNAEPKKSGEDLENPKLGRKPNIISKIAPDEEPIIGTCPNLINTVEKSSNSENFLNRSFDLGPITDKKLKLEDFPRMVLKSKIRSSKYFMFLQRLDLSNNFIDDLEGIQFCSNLMNINLSKNNLANVEVLKKCPLLMELTLFENPISLNQDYRFQVLLHIQQLKFLDFVEVTHKEKVKALNFSGLERSDLLNRKNNFETEFHAEEVQWKNWASPCVQ